MDTTSIAGAAAAISLQTTREAIGIAVVRNAVQAEQQMANILLESVQKPQNLPSNLGQNINTTA